MTIIRGAIALLFIGHWVMLPGQSKSKAPVPETTGPSIPSKPLPNVPVAWPPATGSTSTITTASTALAASGFSCVLNDTRSVRGPWDHSMDWVINEWAPNAAKAGLRHFAMISTPETLADGSAARFYGQLTAFQCQVFDNLAEARQWLHQYIQPG